MRKLVCILAVAFAAVALAPSAYAQQSTWTAKPVLKRLGDAPTGFNSSEAYATAGQETPLGGVAYVDRDGQAAMRIGVYLQMTTDGADANEGLDGIAASHWQDAIGRSTNLPTIIGMDNMVGGVFFSPPSSGTVTQSAVDTYIRNSGMSWQSGLATDTQASSHAGVEANSDTTSYTRIIDDAGSRPRVVVASVAALLPKQVRGIWCEPDPTATPANSCEVLLGIINLPLNGIPAALESLSVSWGEVNSEAGTGSWKMSASHRRANVTSPASGDGDAVKYDFCSGDECVTDYVSFAVDADDVDEGTGTGNSIDVTVEFAQNSGLASDLTVPITLNTTASTAARTAYTVTSSDGSTTHIDRDTTGTPITFNVTIPATSGTLPTDAVTASTTFRVTTVPNEDDVPAASESTSVVFGFGTIPVADNAERAVGANDTMTVNILDDDGPDFTVGLELAQGSNTSAIEGIAAANRLTVAVDVTVEATNGDGGTLEEPVEFKFNVTSASTPAATVTWDETGTDNRDIDIEDLDRDDNLGNDWYRVTYDHTTGTGTVWLAGHVGNATTGIEFVVIAIDDADSDVDESVQLAVSAETADQPAGRTVTAGPMLTVPITDDDSNSVTLSLGTTTIAEDETIPTPLPITATVVLSNTAGNTGPDAMTLSVSVEGGTATSGTGNDYTIDAGPFTVAIPANTAHNATFTVNVTNMIVLDDTSVEPNETVVFVSSIAEDANSDGTDTAATFGAGRVTFRITDDSAESATLRIVDGADVDEGGSATFTVSLNNAVEAAFTASWAVHFDDAAVTVDSDDFPQGAASGLLSFDNPAAGTAGEQTITIPTLDDELSEGSEDIRLSLTVDGSDVTDSLESRIATAGTSTDSGSEATVAINASDALTVALSASATAVNEGGSLVLTATVSGGVSTTEMMVPVRLQSSPTLESGESAADNADVTEDLTSVAITIPANATSGTLSLGIVKDTTAEADQFLFLEIQDPTGASGAATADTSANTAKVEITEFVNVSLALTVGGADATSVAEADSTTVTGTATFDGSYTVPSGGLAFTWAVVHGTTVDADFTGATSLGGTLTFAEGAATNTTSQTFAITIANDALSEAAETFNVTLAPPSGLTDLRVGTGSGEGIEFTINANDPLTLTVSGPDRVNEGTSGTYTVTAIGGETTQATQVQINLASTSTADSQDVTTSLPLSLDIPAGAASDATTDPNPRTVTFDVEYVREPVQATSEGEENAVWEVSRVLTSGVNAPTLTSHTTRVIDNLARVADVAANEGSDLVFSIVIDDNTTGAGTIAWSLAFDAAAAVGDAAAGDVGTITVAAPGTVTGTSGTVSFDGSTYTAEVTIPLDDDTVSEPAETFSIQLGEVTGALASAVGVGGDSATATGTINASDPVTLTLTGPDGADPNLVTEGDTATYTVTGTGATAIVEPLTVEFTLATLDAETRADISAGASLPITLTIPTSSTTLVVTQDITFERNADGDPEPESETFTFQLANVAGGGATPVIGGTGVTTTVQNGAASYDFNGNGTISDLDGLLLFNVLNSISQSEMGLAQVFTPPLDPANTEHFLAAPPGSTRFEQRNVRVELLLEPASVRSEQAAREMIAQIVNLRDAGRLPDINGDDNVDATDGLLLFNVLNPISQSEMGVNVNQNTGEVQFLSVNPDRSVQRNVRVELLLPAASRSEEAARDMITQIIGDVYPQ